MIRWSTANSSSVPPQTLTAAASASSRVAAGDLAQAAHLEELDQVQHQPGDQDERNRGLGLDQRST